MQREKLYNLHQMALLIIAGFALKMDTILSYHIWTVRTQYFFVLVSSLSHHFASYYIFLNKTKYDERCSLKSSTNYI